MHDLYLWFQFLHYSHVGIPINLMIERQLNAMFIEESCDNVIGSFSLTAGVAFRHELPDHLKGRVRNNVLEHVAEIVAI